MLAKSKLNSIGTLISQALIDVEISCEEFKNENLGMYKISFIAKEALKNCDINMTVYHNKERGIDKLWLKMSDIEGRLGVENMLDLKIKRLRVAWLRV